MGYVFSVAAGLIAGVAAVLLIEKKRKRKRRRRKKGTVRKVEFSKLFLSAVLFTYFVGVGVGIWAVTIDISQVGVLLAYIGTPTATAIGFYSWKAKAENIVKIKQANPDATEGTPVDLNNIAP